MSGFEPAIVLAQSTVESGGYCIPWPVAAAVVGPLAAAVAYQTRRIAALTDQLLQAYREERERVG